MISKDKFIDALSMLDEEYITQAVNAQAAPEAAATADEMVTPAGTAAAAAATAQPETAGHNRSGRQRRNGRRSVIIGAIVMVLGVTLGVVLALNRRYGDRKQSGDPAGETGNVMTEATQTPSSTKEPYDYTIADFLERVYSDSEAPLITDPGELPTNPPGSRDDARTLRRATDEFVGTQLTLMMDTTASGDAMLLDPVFVLHRDVELEALDGSFLLESGRLVLLLSMDLFTDNGTGRVYSGQRNVLVSGRTDDIDNVVRLSEDSKTAYFGPITVEQVSIIGGFDYMYPHQALTASSPQLLWDLAFYKRPLYQVETDADGMTHKWRIKQPDAVGCVYGFGVSVSSSAAAAEGGWLAMDIDEAGMYDLEPLRTTYERFGLTFPDHSSDGLIIRKAASEADLIEAVLYGYPDYAFFKRWFEGVPHWKLRGRKTLDDGGIMYKYLFKFDDEVVTVTTPVLYDTGFNGDDGTLELGYYIDFDGVEYNVASDSIPMMNGNRPDVFVNHPRTTDRQRSQMADTEPFTVERLPLSEYDAAVARMKEEFAGPEELVAAGAPIS